MISTKRTSSLGEYAALVGLCLTLLSCGSDSSTGGAAGGGGDGGRRGEVLAALGEDIVLPLIEQLQTEASRFEAALGDASSEPGGRDAAQTAWEELMAVWQQLELMQFGPLGSSLTAMGGQDLRARIYTWPILNRCQVDRQTVTEGYDDPDALEQIKGTPLGLWAIEYLLFTEDPGNNCLPSDAINEDGTWDSMSEMIPQRRLDYAAALATLVRRRAEELADAWSPNGGNFIEELRNPGRSGAVYGSAQEGLNAVSDALFYLEKETKDMKLGKPLGITGCSSVQCPEDLESPWARWSKPHALANLVAFQSVFHGGAPEANDLGFDDLMRDMGADDVADDMSRAITSAIAATEAVPDTFHNALSENESAMTDAHTAIQVVTDILKSDFLSVLDLEAPDRAAGDND